MVITQERLKQCLSYNPETGVFTRKEKPITDNRCASWNARYANKPCGCDRGDGYLVIRIDKKLYLAHRLAWLYVYGEIPKVIDHIDGSHSRNNISNLRNTSSSGNMKNRKIASHNKSGYHGIYYHKKCAKWCAQIWSNKSYVGSKTFDDIHDAIAWRHGMERKLNFNENHGRTQ